MKVLITGKPRVGKTTLLRRIYEELSGKSFNIRGFYTGEIREENKRVGFFIENFRGKRKIFAHRKIKSEFRVGKYGVDIEALEDIGVPEIEEAIKEKNLLMIDEIGKMELFSRKFQESVKEAFDSEIDIIATIAISPHPFIKELKKRKDVKIYGLNEEKREYLFRKIIELCQKELRK